MALKFLFDLLTGNLALVDVPGDTTPPTGGSFLYVDSTGFSFIDGTDIDFIT